MDNFYISMFMLMLSVFNIHLEELNHLLAGETSHLVLGILDSLNIENKHLSLELSHNLLLTWKANWERGT